LKNYKERPGRDSLIHMGEDLVGGSTKGEDFMFVETCMNGVMTKAVNFLLHEDAEY